MKWTFNTLTPNVLYTFGGILAGLVLASIVAFALAKIKKDSDFTELRLRINTWWVLVGLIAAVLLSTIELSILFFALISVLALYEFLSLIDLRKPDRKILWVPFLVIPLQYFWVYERWYGMFIVFIPVYAFLFFPLAMVSIGETRGFLKAVGTLQWGLMTCVFSISHGAFLMVLPQEKNPAGGGPGLVLYLLLLTQFNDVAQYIWGKLLGRHPITPRVSPKKTVEGFLGGLVTTVVLSYFLAPLLTPLNLYESLGAGLLIGFSGFVGDVTLSAVKRDIQVKDSGSMLPGHGGILDRIDSLTFTAPLFFHFIYYFRY
ncbi:MAG TPA: phosphatidate cytidylyltransferase [Leptospiraceae bacterium]|nr:phosphatidate cytidylyltransferase [Spirochaetaceae bacterium]HBS06885.1 phosphatidate cytidylyltransferase [Leptospiraceae bacterium]|tara:strand:- start:58081 stop:59028 length:948 start_codon:yes stop_codon:yes gene_type:complete